MATSKYAHKMVNGELIELTADEIAECEQREQEALANPPAPPAKPE